MSGSEELFAFEDVPIHAVELSRVGKLHPTHGKRESFYFYHQGGKNSPMPYCYSEEDTFISPVGQFLRQEHSTSLHTFRDFQIATGTNISIHRILL